MQVAENLGNLVEVVRWAASHEVEAAAIARRGQELAEQLHVLDAACYWRATLGASGDSVACPWGASLYARHSYSSLAWPVHPSV